MIGHELVDEWRDRLTVMDGYFSLPDSRLTMADGG